MLSGFDPGALLARSYHLPRGPRVCLRLARPRDLDGVQRLFEHQGVEPGELEIARLVRPDPRRRLVICATALIGSAETVVGLGAISLDEDVAAGLGPELVIVDEQLTDGLAQLLSDALIGRAEILAHGRAESLARSRAA